MPQGLLLRIKIVRFGSLDFGKILSCDLEL